ncbi:MAG TPA: retropepsin-like aspartic protease [Bryobacteraceae bacterium]|nr:retropepsin-like aspartic protease [Bryobacteraceae bacterium]
MLWRFLAVILFSFTLPAQPVVRLRAAGPYFLVDGIHVNGQGPFRFLLDTGAQSTAVTPQLARKLSLRPTYRVEVVSVNGVVNAIGTKVSDVTLGSAKALGAEVLWYDLSAVQRVDPTMDGVLGQSFLGRFRYSIDVRKRLLKIEEEAPRTGMRIPFEP